MTEDGDWLNRLLGRKSCFSWMDTWQVNLDLLTQVFDTGDISKMVKSKCKKCVLRPWNAYSMARSSFLP